MITLHFSASGKQVGVRFDDDVNPPPMESVSSVVVDETTNAAIVNALKNAPQDVTYINGVLKSRNVILTVNSPSVDSTVKSAIKGKVAAKILDLRNGTAVFNAEMQKALYYILTRLMEKVK